MLYSARRNRVQIRFTDFKGRPEFHGEVGYSKNACS
jgi:hypothetical protein